jgi:cysteine dioxygenase
LDRPLLSRPNGYTRTRAYGDDHFEVLLLTWDAGAASAVHDHGGQHCWMLVLRGSLQVDDYVRLDRGERPGIARVEARDGRLLTAGGLDLRSGPLDLHRVSATSDAPALSLHIYARPLQRFLVYDETAETCAPAEGLCDADLASAHFVAG